MRNYKWDIKPLFSSPRLHSSRPKSLDDYFSKKQWQDDTRKTKCAFVPEVHQRGFADTYTGYIVASILPITLSCNKNKVPAWRVKNESDNYFKNQLHLHLPEVCNRWPLLGIWYLFRRVHWDVPCFVFFFRPLLQQQSRLFSSREFVFFWIIQKLYRCYQYWEKN